MFYYANKTFVNELERIFLIITQPPYYLSLFLIGRGVIHLYAFILFQMRVKALFTYDPESDPNNPCPDASLAFQRGEILHIVNQDDASWWQARKEGEIIGRAGLIPSKQLQERFVVVVLFCLFVWFFVFCFVCLFDLI